MIVLDFDYCALLLIVVMIISAIVKGVTKGKINTFFMLLLVLSFFATVADILCSVVSMYNVTENRQFMNFVNYVYYLSNSNILMIYFLYCFSNMKIWHLVKKGGLIANTLWISTLIANVLIISNPYHHWIFTIDSANVYHRGDYIGLLYALTFIGMISGALVVIKHRKMVSREKIIVILGVLIINAISVALQFFFSNIMLQLFMMSAALCVLVLVVQRQDEFLDPITGAKKYNAGVEEFKKMMNAGMPCSIILLKHVNHTKIRLYLGQSNYNKFLRHTTSYLRTIDEKYKLNSQIFYLEYGLFAMLSPRMEHKRTDEAAREIRNYFEDMLFLDDYVVLSEAKLCIVKSPQDIADYTTLLTFGTSFHTFTPLVRDPLLFRDYGGGRDFKIRNELDAIIFRGFENNAYEVYYQPIYSVNKEKFVSAEALIRLKDEKFGDVSPAMFIPVAENNGAIHAIGNFVVESVCRFISEYKPEEHGIENFQINLSASQCIEVDLVEKIVKTLKKYGVSSKKIVFEITESAADIDPEIVDKNIGLLYDSGIQFALDDYGTGYSNIKRVTGLPIDMVKLDREFIKNYDDEASRIIIEDTIAMLKSIGKKVLVEGVESEDGAKFFTQYGCDYIQGCEYLQGFYYCRPLPAQDFMNFISRRN